jgi:hypothetical protein
MCLSRSPFELLFERVLAEVERQSDFAPKPQIPCLRRSNCDAADLLGISYAFSGSLKPDATSAAPSTAR